MLPPAVSAALQLRIEPNTFQEIQMIWLDVLCILLEASSHASHAANIQKCRFSFNSAMFRLNDQIKCTKSNTDVYHSATSGDSISHVHA